MLFLFSRPAALLYEHRGYRTTGHGIIDLENDVNLSSRRWRRCSGERRNLMVSKLTRDRWEDMRD